MYNMFHKPTSLMLRKAFIIITIALSGLYGNLRGGATVISLSLSIYIYIYVYMCLRIYIYIYNI
jgi:hypothetical protein